MLRQLIHGSLGVGEVIGHSTWGEARWSWLVVLTGSVMALISAVGMARRLSETLVCVETAGEQC